MRAPDENQAGSKSPQIVPHTRSGKDGQNDRTLARLERAGPRSGGAGGRLVRLALLGGSGLLVVGLVSVLVSLAGDKVEMPPIVEAADPRLPLPAASGNRPAPLMDERDKHHIATVDTADPPALVRLTSDRGDRPDPPSAAVLDAKPVISPVPAPIALPAVKALVAAPAGRLPAQSTGAPKPPPVPAAAAKKTRIVPVPVQIEAPVIDTDVALLSAILAQSMRHSEDRAEHEAAACAEAQALSRRCTDKPAAARP